MGVHDRRRRGRSVQEGKCVHKGWRQVRVREPFREARRGHGGGEFFTEKKRPKAMEDLDTAEAVLSGSNEVSLTGKAFQESKEVSRTSVPGERGRRRSLQGKIVASKMEQEQSERVPRQKKTR